jgi:kumamolisin
MYRFLLQTAIAACILTVIPCAVQPARAASGTVEVPPSSIARPGDRGLRVHSTVLLFVPDGQRIGRNAQPSGNYETPASLACLYGITTHVKGCNPQTLKTVAAGGSNAIALVDPYDYPTAFSDLSVFSAQFGLPAVTDTNFQVVYAAGTKPRADPTGAWELEEALDIEVAHALAPLATVYLVEASSNTNADLLVAERLAGQLVATAGGGEVSNSWIGSETANEEQT